MIKISLSITKNKRMYQAKWHDQAVYIEKRKKIQIAFRMSVFSVSFIVFSMFFMLCVKPLCSIVLLSFSAILIHLILLKKNKKTYRVKKNLKWLVVCVHSYTFFVSTTSQLTIEYFFAWWLFVLFLFRQSFWKD